MSLPFIVTPSVPQGTDSPVNGPSIFHALWTLWLDVFGIPANTPISGAIMSLGANVDGKVATLPVTKAANPFLRLIGTEGLARDVRTIEEGGVYSIQVNTGTETIPTWQDAWRFGLNSTSAAAFVNANTTFRTYTFPDADGTVALVETVGFPTGTKMAFFQSAAPTGWTRVVDSPHTDSVVRVLTNSETPGFGGTWTITGLTAPHVHDTTPHKHETPVGAAAGGGTGGAGLIVTSPAWPHGTGSSFLMSDAAWNGTDVVNPAMLTGPGIGNTASTSPTVTNGSIFPIIGVNTGTKTFTVAGDQTANFIVGTTVTVSASTGNNGSYTVAVVTFSAGNTLVQVVESIPSAIADGFLSSPGTWRPKYTDCILATKL